MNLAVTEQNFSDTQIALLKLFPSHLTTQDLSEIKRLVAPYFEENGSDEIWRKYAKPIKKRLDLNVLIETQGWEDGDKTEILQEIALDMDWDESETFDLLLSDLNAMN